MSVRKDGGMGATDGSAVGPRLPRGASAAAATEERCKSDHWMIGKEKGEDGDESGKE